MPPQHPSELQPLLSETADFQVNDVEQLVRGLKLRKLLRELQRRGQSVIAAMKDRWAADRAPSAAGRIAVHAARVGRRPEVEWQPGAAAAAPADRRHHPAGPGLVRPAALRVVHLQNGCA